MSDKTPAEAEATETDVVFKHFDREWHVPAKRSHKHLVETKRILRAEGSLDADDIAAVYLSAEEYAQLLELNVPEADLTAFANEIAKQMGFGDSGNSEPSSPSS